MRETGRAGARHPWARGGPDAPRASGEATPLREGACPVIVPAGRRGLPT